MNIELSSDYDSYKNPIEGKTYVSPSIKDTFGNDSNMIRIITRGIESTKSYEMIKIDNEIVLRETSGGKNIITAKVFEDTRKIKVLNIQEYTAKTGNPHKLGFAFIGDEINKLYNFLKDTQTMQFGSEKYHKISDDEIEHIELTDKQALVMFQKHSDLFSNVVRSQVTNEDIVAIGYRKEQLDIFKKLLTDKEFFENAKRNYTSSEKVWQCYFEKNQWIFGYGLGYVFLSGLDDKKLEQVVQGYSITDYGKRVDALMKTKGIISTLCFVEIKTDETQLLESTCYRSGCFSPSKELSGAISQVQGTVFSAIKTLKEKVSIKDTNGNPSGEDVFNYNPKSFLVIGNLKEFITENGINNDKLKSFELFRKSINGIEVITFDELYQRAKFIVDYNDANSK